MNLETTADRMRRKLTAAFAPVHLEIDDESGRHIGHAGHRPGRQTHFHVKIISDAFAGLTKLACHRAVYAVLADDMQEGGIHALALEAAAREEDIVPR
jgi:BolA protein